MKNILLVLFLSVFSLSVFSQDIPEQPNPPRLVNDLANLLCEQEKIQLESELVRFDQKTSNQIAILTTPTLNSYDISDFSIKTYKKWKIGQAKKNNGILIILKPKTEKEKGSVFIVVGYGLEGNIPDVIVKRIINKEIVPRLKDGDTYGGLQAGAKVLMELAANKYSAKDYILGKGEKNSKGGGFFVMILIIIVLILLFMGSRGRNYNGGRSLPFWIAMSLMGSSRGSGYFGDFSGANDSFGGFGGGMTGGGGAGGSW
jgi:uncharacterized protein